MSFNRKRVALACSFCRHRKRRCDAGKPRCQNCVEAEVECQYDETPSQRIDTSGGSREILNKLRHIESMLDHHTRAVAALSSELQLRTAQEDNIQGTSPNSHTSSVPGIIGSRLNVPITAWPSQPYDGQPDVSALPPLDIPVKHKTSSNYLLSLPAMKALVGEYPNDLFFLLESKNPLPPELAFESLPPPAPPIIHIDRDTADYLVTSFFATAHANHPVLDEEHFREVYAEFLERGIDSSVESAMCLSVLAIGAAAIASPETRDFSGSPPGMEYMQHAMPKLISLSSWSVSYSVPLAQTLVLASIYFAYIVRPLQSWRLIHSACTFLQFKLSGFDTREEGAESRESTLRLVWSSFLVECDRLAELELPRSGLQQLIDETPLPSCSNLGGMIHTSFLAETSIRRLLNRIHNSLYPSRKSYALTLSSTSLMAPEEFSAQEISSMMGICDELQRQLDLWHASIPEAYRPSLAVGPAANDREAVLRIRYFAARHIIYRPFVLNISMNPGPHPESIIEKAALGIASCRLYLRSATNILRKPSPYTWTFSLSSLGAVIVLTLSSLSPELKHLVPDIDELQTLAIQNIRPWAISSLGTVVTILEDMQRKQRILSCI
ncbi:hypothetical protein jhhlp_004449 [Lomentospora prolificans]|uniref:Zn(2)-C6 fungal-type domain-containing protein n=1 Tax=Lomentospora prolificans TaxID=41688 RepID=A0A2N3NBK3_9PEZI|nr:hypothetical protein jhhlp_004449 [Lomentospora prolificans]